MKNLTKGSFSQKEFTWYKNPDPSLPLPRRHSGGSRRQSHPTDDQELLGQNYFTASTLRPAGQRKA